MLGCDFHCAYCQNWVTSQALRRGDRVAHRRMTPAQMVRAARRSGARLVVSSYNEPLITAEWAVAVFQEAKGAGLGMRVCLQRQRDARSARFPAALDGRLQD